MLRADHRPAKRPVAATEALEPDGERDDDDGPEQIRERALLYLKRHGEGGRIDPERRREKVAAEYSRFREEERRVGGRSILSVGGSNWVSLGPTNGAGRMTAIAPHPTDSGTVLAGAAGGGVWKTTDAGVSWVPLTDGLNDLSVGAIAYAPSGPNT
ncbi:MAG: hypothetical protein ABI914_02150, partial [Acidobacteriota bacterium]